MLRHLVLFVVLFGFWILLSGQVDVTDAHQRYLFVCGLISAAIGTALAKRVGFLYDEDNVWRLSIGQISYMPWLLWQVLMANLDVLKRVWSLNPSRNIRPHLLRVPYETESDLATVFFANSITLTPGTVTVLIDTDKKEILVYALSDVSASGLKAMHDRVRAMEGKK